MRAFHLHMPRLKPPLRPLTTGQRGREHHPRHRPLPERLGRLERLIDYAMIALIVGLAVTMGYGLLYASGEARWFQ